MSNVTLTRNLIRSFLMILMSVTLINAQAPWRNYVSFDRSFSVEFPLTAVIRRHTRKTPKLFKDAALENTRFLDAYTLKSLSTASKAELWISAYRCTKPITDLAFDREVHVLALIIGGDKQDSDFMKQVDVRVGAFHGREYMFERNSSFYRLRFINTGERIYFLVYHTVSNHEITSGVVNRIFESFKPGEKR